MEKEEDEDLERIKEAKLREMLKRSEKGSDTEKRGEPVEVDERNFEDVKGRSGLVVIDFWASWCAPCRMMSPIIDEMARDYAGKILFGKLNVDRNQEIASKYQIVSIPTLLVFRDGELVDRIVGVFPKRLLEERLLRHIKP
ncbi:MAG: thioredoxin [Nitrososphaerota archaeon]|nr:thioredoxin [Candidatus Bathyarchaeota archaeon]MDW8048725.1 thioredoxin [Nitrososphaerota archaeon]